MGISPAEFPARINIFIYLSVNWLQINLNLLNGSGKNSQKNPFLLLPKLLKTSEVINRNRVEKCG